MIPILHITERSRWDRQQALGHYEAESLSAAGFIHCSTPAQVLGVVNVLFRGCTGLVLLVIDPARCQAQVVYENLDGGDKLFPHLYGPLNLEAIQAVLQFPPDANGLFHLPDALLHDLG